MSENEIKTIQTAAAPAAIGPYSQAKIYGGLIYTSGQIPLSERTCEVVGENITDQTEQIMRNIEAVLTEAGSGFERVIKTTCFLTDMANFAEFNAVYAKYFTTNPARSCVAVSALPKGVLAEIEAVAALRGY